MASNTDSKGFPFITCKNLGCSECAKKYEPPSIEIKEIDVKK